MYIEILLRSIHIPVYCIYSIYIYIQMRYLVLCSMIKAIKCHIHYIVKLPGVRMEQQAEECCWCLNRLTQVANKGLEDRSVEGL